jgi:hypothetical protein
MNDQPTLTGPPIPPTEYVFTDTERAAMNDLRTQMLLSKERIHDLNVALEAEQAKLKELTKQVEGAMRVTIARVGMPQAQISPDYSKLVRG